MPLHLQQHKSYHPYNKDNVERVRRDEEAARIAEESKGEQSLLAESEARLEALKRQRHKQSAGGHDRLKTAEREIDGKHGALEAFDLRQRGEIEAGPSRADNRSDSLVDRSGHINFWANEEHARKRQRGREEDNHVGKRRGNSEYEADKKAEKQKWEEKSTMFLGKPAKGVEPWYQSKDLQSSEERKRSHEQRLEAAYKDSVIKRSHDPLQAMPTIPAQRHHQHSRQPPISTLTSSSSSQGTDDLHVKALQRERVERAKAEALIASRRAASSGFKIEETPTPRRAEYHDQFNRDDVRAAQGWRGATKTDREQDFRGGPELVDPGQTQEEIQDIDESATVMETSEGIEECTKAEAKRGGMEGGASPLRQLDLNTGMKRNASDSSTDSTSSLDTRARPSESMYPAIFGEMISTVLQEESYLFSDREQTLLRSFFDMDYEARHLLARLIQRRSSWHRLDKLHYDFDVKDKAGAVSNLCRPVLDNKTAGDDDEESPTRFCLSEQDMEGGEEEALGLLGLEELKVVAKKMNRLKGSTTTTKASLISSLLRTKGQGTLHSFAARSDSLPLVKSQSAMLHQTLREIIGGCVRVCPRAHNLVNRVALVYYRGAELGGSALTTAVLSRSRKRRYPEYDWQRSSSLFASRKHLISMERTLSVEAQMDELIEWDGSKEALSKAMKLFETAYPEWQDAVKEGQSLADEEEATIDRLTYHRMRFHPGWPLTRIIYKGVHILARFHLHSREAEVLQRLLAQRIFRRGRRGDWYDRLALITAQYPPSSQPNDVRRARREALAISVQGIQDPDTHLIYHDTLQRRIVRLESQLKLPFGEKHDFSYAKLKRCEERIFTGTRLDKMVGANSGLFGSSFVDAAQAKVRPKGSPGLDNSDISAGFQSRKPLHKVVKGERTTGKEEREGGEVERQVDDGRVKRDMHSVWRGLDGESCRVESLVLQHYEREGFRGYHCEGGILTMLFALLMWDILFTPLSGVFETPYQRQPLDLSEDSFAVVRGPMIRQRLSQIEETGGLHFIRQTDERERERRTWAVGCRWDEYPRQDLLEIAQCMGGKALAVICQMLSEEWDKITAGLPDLCVWRLEGHAVRFCEVKGPGDRLSDKQKLWIDILLRAGLEVEVSLVKEGGNVE